MVPQYLGQIRSADSAMPSSQQAYAQRTSDQPAHPRSLISHRCPPADALDPLLPTKCASKDFDQTEMHRLISVLAGCTLNLAGMMCSDSNAFY